MGLSPAGRVHPSCLPQCRFPSITLVRFLSGPFYLTTDTTYFIRRNLSSPPLSVCVLPVASSLLALTSMAEPSVPEQ